MDYLEGRKTLYDEITSVVGVLIAPSAQAFPGISIPNPNVTPRLEVNQVAANHPVVSLKGDVPIEVGVLQLFVVGQKGIGQDAAMAVAQIIADGMPVKSTYPFNTTNKIIITDPPSIGAAYQDDTSWRVPIEIQYLAK